jgi:acyl-CoA synthetase (AMP-forming)/AMP-acid ligase II
VYQPAYGLAEATLAVALGRSASRGRLLRADPDSLRFGAEVRVTGRAWLGAALLAARDGWLVGHGIPARRHGVKVLVVDEDGAALPEGCLGEISVTGPTVTAGYHGELDSGTTRFLDGELRTGDAGFLLDGDLFVLGRMGDSLKVNGRSVYVEDLDIRASAATGLDRSRLAMVSTYDTGHGAGVVLFAETRAVGAWADAARAALRGQLGTECPIVVVAGPPGMIERTSSGKPRRRRMWQLFQSGRLPKASVVDEGAEARPADAVVTR